MAERALKEQALATLQAGRRELGAEAEWFRRKMSPKRMVTKVVHEHTMALLACAFAVGLALPWIVLRRKNGHENPVSDEAGGGNHSHDRGTTKVKKQPVKVGTGAYLAGLALKIAMPLLLQTGMQAWRHWLSAGKGDGTASDDAAHEPVEAR